MKTYSPKPQDIERRWYVLDASDQVLGRLASEAAVLLRGKHKPIFAPHMDTGDHVIIVNAAKVQLTGGKEEKKIAYRHSGYPGGITATNYATLLATKPAFAVEKAVKGMLPKNRLGRAMVKKLHVVAGPEHSHAAQAPVPIAVGERPAWSGFPAPVVRKPTASEKEKAAKAKRPAVEEPPSEEEESRTSEAAEVKKPAPKPKSKSTSAVKKPTAAKRTSAKATSAKPTASKRASAAKSSAAKGTTTKRTTAKRTTSKKTTPKKTEE